MIQMTLKIDGMACSMCESHVNDAVRKNFAVKKVTSSHAKGETVIVTEQTIDHSVLKDTIEKNGYRVLEITESPYEKKGLFSFLKK